MKTTMQAMILEQFEWPLILKTVKTPIPKRGQVIVKIIAAGINPLDLKIKNGKAAHAQVKTPAIIGLDMAGIIVGLGEGVIDFKVGDEVYGLVGGVGNKQGTMAEYIIADADHIALKAKNISMKEAAVTPLVLITAWEGLVDRAKVHKGQKVLVHGGAGGVGHMAIQIAQAFGAEVFATASGKGLTYIESLGATAIDYTTTQLEDYLEKYTKGKGFDIVFDTLGGNTLDNAFKSVKRYTGHVITSLGWGTHNLAPLSFLGATYSGVFTLLPLLTGEGQAHHGEILASATKIIEEGKLKPLLSPKTFALSELNEALSELEKPSGIGKIAIGMQ